MYKRKSILHAIKASLKNLNKEAIKFKEQKLRNKSKIHLGRSPSLSSFFEKTITKEISKIYPQYDFYVDYPITLLNHKKKSFTKRQQPIYPDIMISKKKKLRALIEIKLDIGHLSLKKSGRCSITEKNLKNAKFVSFNSVVGAYSKKEKQENKKIILQIPRNLKKIAIVATTRNEHKVEGQPKSDNYKKDLINKGYEPLFLLKKTHFNTIENISRIVDEEIDLIKKEIMRTFKNF